MYERAIDADPTHANTLNNYATFLTDVRGDFGRAEGLFERAVAAYPTDANVVGNFSRLLFVSGRRAEGEQYARQALTLAGPGEAPLRAECSFYLFAHLADVQAGGVLKELLAAGVSTGEWSFAANLDRVGVTDPRHELLVAVAQALAVGDPAGLDQYPEWAALP